VEDSRRQEGVDDVRCRQAGEGTGSGTGAGAKEGAGGLHCVSGHRAPDGAGGGWGPDGGGAWM